MSSIEPNVQRTRCKTAAALVIGNELLSGKIPEKNVMVLARVLRPLGIALQRVVIIPDEIEVIARETRTLSADFDYVFTSGGVGPTHDDLTVQGVAKAFGRHVVRSPRLTAEIQRSLGPRTEPGHLLMARIPEGARLVGNDDRSWPTVVCRNVWLLPGVPDIFAKRMPAVRAALTSNESRPFVTVAVNLRMDEANLLPALQQTVSSFPDVQIGSYPETDDQGAYTKITFDGKEPDRVNDAAQTLLRHVG